MIIWHLLLAELQDNYENVNTTLANLLDDKFRTSEVKRAEYERKLSNERLKIKFAVRHYRLQKEKK